MVPLDPAEMARVKSGFDTHVRTMGPSGGEFFGEFSFAVSPEDVALSQTYWGCPLDWLRIRDEDEAEYFRQQYRINKWFFQFCVAFEVNKVQNAEEEPVMVDLVKGSGMCSEANILLYKLAYLEAAETIAYYNGKEDFYTETLEGRALSRLREPENQLLKRDYPRRKLADRSASFKTYKPPLYKIYDTLLPAPFLVDARLHEINDRMVSLYLIS